MKLIALLFLLFPSSLFAQVPPATPGCADPRGCSGWGGGEERHGGRERGGDGERHSSLKPAESLYNDSIDKIRAGDFDGAFIAVRQALAHDQNFSPARYQYAWLLMHEGRCDAAIVQAQMVRDHHAGQANQLIAYCSEQIKKEQAERALSYGTKIGGISRIEGEAYWVAPDGRRIPVGAGTQVYLNEHLVTEPGSHLVITLADDTVFTLGGDSDLTLDEFVYDPGASAGKITARLTKGVFRWVTGKVQRNLTNEKVIVPSGAGGIRGTDFDIKVVGDDFSRVNACDAQGRCKDYVIKEAIRLYSGAFAFTSGASGHTYPIKANGQYFLTTADGNVIELDTERNLKTLVEPEGGEIHVDPGVWGTGPVPHLPDHSE